MRRALGYLVVSLLSLNIVRAQLATGEITGTVADATGAVVGGATVTVTDPATNTQRTVITNSAGVYDVPALLPGTYNLKAEMKGFATQVRNDIELQVAQVARIDFSLRVGTSRRLWRSPEARRCCKPRPRISARWWSTAASRTCRSTGATICNSLR